jgi:hypothetical protein
MSMLTVFRTVVFFGLAIAILVKSKSTWLVCSTSNSASRLRSASYVWCYVVQVIVQVV